MFTGKLNVFTGNFIVLNSMSRCLYFSEILGDPLGWRLDLCQKSSTKNHYMHFSLKVVVVVVVLKHFDR